MGIREDPFHPCPVLMALLRDRAILGVLAATSTAIGDLVPPGVALACIGGEHSTIAAEVDLYGLKTDPKEA